LAKTDAFGRPRRLIAGPGILAAYILLAVAMTWPMARDFARAIPGDGFDGWQNYWNLWWVKIALVNQHTGPFFTNLLFYPTGVSLLFHTLNLFNGLLSLPVQLAFGLFPAYNSVVLFSFAMGGFGAYLLGRHTLGTDGAILPAFAAGVIFSYSPFHFAHLLGHMQVISLEWIPFYALYLLRAVQGATRRAPIRRDVPLAALFLALIGLCDFYYVLYCLFFTILVLGWAVWRAWRVRRLSIARYPAGQSRDLVAQPGARRAAGVPQLLLAVAVIWIIFVLALSPQLMPMLTEARRSDYMVPDPAQSRVLSADLIAFVTPQEFHPLWGKWAAQIGSSLAASPAEHQVFAGFTVLALAALGLWVGWRSTARVRVDAGPWPLSLLVFFILALGPVLHIDGRSVLLPAGGELPLPYGWLVRAVPFMNITRSVSRFDVMIMLSLGVLATVALQWLWSHGDAGRIGAAVALGLILFEFLPVPYPMSPPDTPSWYGTLALNPEPGAVLNLPMAWDRPGYLLHQTVHGKPLTVAYISRDDPRTLTDRIPVLQHFRHLGPDVIQFDLAEQGRQVLNDLGVRWVILDRYQMPSGEERTYTDAATAAIFGNQAPLFEDDRITVYEVPPTERSAPYLLLGEGWSPFDGQAGTRSFNGGATVIVHSPSGGDVLLVVTPGPGSAPLDLPNSEGHYTIAIHTRSGDNVVSLRTLSPGQQGIVAALSLDTIAKENSR
jgi:hypothetical protein